MALLTYKGTVLSALLLLLGSSILVVADEDDTEEATVETVEETDTYTSPQVDPTKVFFAEHFDDVNSFEKRWVRSQAKKQGVAEDIAMYNGKWEIERPARKVFKDDLGLVLTTAAKHAAISALLDRPFVFNEKPLVVQYEVTMQEGQDCGGAYIKLLSKGTNSNKDLRNFHDQTAYTIMFGPDKCGTDSKLHFIFRHKNPINGSYEEKHAKKPSERLDEIYKDKEPHLYTLIVNPDNTFSVLIDNREVNSGSLLEDFTPPVNPPEEIDDPDDRKPDDWDEREKIVDPNAVKPDDWDEDAPAHIVDANAVRPDGWLEDEPLLVPDPTAEKPSDWDEDMDGEWNAPLIDNPRCSSAPGCGPWAPPTVPNPEYKGKWRAPLIPNPNYRGKWHPRRIPNPDHFRDERPFRMTTINAIGFELWSMSPRLLFDNVLVTDDLTVARQYAELTFVPKRTALSKNAGTLWGRMLKAMNYKPGYWAIYIVYCMIPIAIYVGYLLSRVNEKESVFDRFVSMAADNPAIYAVMIVAIIVVIAIVMCFRTGGSDPVDGAAKKSDAVSPGDAPPEEDDDDDDDGDGDGDEVEPQPHSKADLEKSEDEETFESEGEPQNVPNDQGDNEVEKLIDEDSPKVRQRKKKGASEGKGDDE